MMHHFTVAWLWVKVWLKLTLLWEKSYCSSYVNSFALIRMRTESSKWEKQGGVYQNNCKMICCLKNLNFVPQISQYNYVEIHQRTHYIILREKQNQRQAQWSPYMYCTVSDSETLIMIKFFQGTNLTKTIKALPWSKRRAL